MLLDCPVLSLPCVFIFLSFDIHVYLLTDFLTVLFPHFPHVQELFFQKVNQVFYLKQKLKLKQTIIKTKKSFSALARMNSVQN